MHATRENVNIEILQEQEKRSFFSILTPRVVKVKITLNEEKVNVVNVEETRKEHKREPVSSEVLENRKIKSEEFLKEFIRKLNIVDIDYKIDIEDDSISINITGADSEFLIGYRGDVLNSLQTIISSVINKDSKEKVRVLLNIQGYKEKRKKSLEILAVKLAKTVMKNGKSITLEPMNAYERKIIHSRLQSFKDIKTHSIGEEPYRKIIIEKK